MAHILLTGGSGFIGSHILVELIKSKHKITIIDSNVNSSCENLEKISEIPELKNICSKSRFDFIKGDLRNFELLKKIFQVAKDKGNKFEAVIHLAGLKAVGDSKSNPLAYWDSNVLGSISLLKIMDQFQCRTIIFSSSATIYSSNSEGFYNEYSEVKPINPYGNTKATVENILRDLYESSPNSWRVINLRYFNPIGAHPSGKICENPKGKPNNIFPLILKVASSELDCLKIFGNNWDTIDGTGSRDYVHVMDIAEGHLMALNYLLKKSHLFLNLNLGTGVGTTVLELIKAFESANDLKLKYIFSERREGDISKSIADNTLAKELLGWRPKRNLIDMCKDGWKSKVNANS